MDDREQGIITPAKVTRATVVITVTRAPRRAQVVLRGPATYSVVTDEQGRATIGDVKPGSYRVTAQRAKRAVGKASTVMIAPGLVRLSLAT